MLKKKRQRNQKGYGKIKSTEEWLEKEHKKQWKVNEKRKEVEEILSNIVQIAK